MENDEPNMENDEPSMELEDFKQLWNAYDRKLDASMRLNTALVQHANLNRVETSMRSLTRVVVMELVFNVIAILLIGSFAGNHATEPALLIPAALLGVYFIVLVAQNVRQIVTIHAIDYDEPVVTIDKHLAQMRIMRIRNVQAILVTAPLLWVPLLIVALSAIFGINAYATLGTAYLAANFAFGVAFIALMWWISKRYANAFAASPVLRALADDLAGRSLIKATQSLDTILRFNTEEPAA